MHGATTEASLIFQGFNV